MRLTLSKLALGAVHGIYGREGNRLPERMRYLEPAAAKSFLELEGVVVSDMLRSPESSLAARRRSRGAQPPGWSGHNYGLSIDLSVTKTLRNRGENKTELDAYMLERGWYCHRLDHKRKREEWHYNHGIGPYVKDRDRYNSAALERRIQADFADAWDFPSQVLQSYLQDLKLYLGEIDGIVGPLSKEAVRAFQRAWLLRVDGIAGRRTRRTLALVTAGRVLV
jgi:hypothetical protein